VRLAAAAALAAMVLSAGARGQAPPAAGRHGRVIADTLWSQSLGVRKQALVYLPPDYDRDASRRFAVAYYLHGLWGNETDWVKLARLDAAMDSLIAAGGPAMIVVMPDGDDGWYTTWNSLGDWRGCLAHPPAKEPAASYCVPWPHYDDYVARDLVAHVDATFRTRAERAHRAIAGLSMGGLGAVALALAYPDVFSAAASHSGVLSPLYQGPHPFAGTPVYASDERALRAGWGERFWPLMVPVFGRDTAGWWARDPSRLARRLKESRGGPMPALFLDVGRDDGLADQSRAFHASLTALGLPHAYAEWPGKHDWAYWRAHVGESLAWLAERIAR
jgi:putative tributyrin esterase